MITYEKTEDGENVYCILGDRVITDFYDLMDDANDKIASTNKELYKQMKLVTQLQDALEEAVNRLDFAKEVIVKKENKDIAEANYEASRESLGILKASISPHLKASKTTMTLHEHQIRLHKGITDE
jgi:chromosome condensin MukBEF ATPase and DNA-binding subunit MukB